MPIYRTDKMKNSYESEKLELVEDLELYDFSKYLSNSESKIFSTEKDSYANINKHLTNTLLNSAENQAIFIEDDGHWVGLYVDVKSNKITFIDPLGHDLKQYSQINDAIKDSLEQKAMPKFEVEQLLTRDHRIQYDINNCGRFVAASMIAFDKGWKKEDFYLSDKQPENIRQKAFGDFAIELDNILFTQQDQSMDYQKANKVIKSLENFRNVVNGKNQQQEVQAEKQKISPEIKKESKNVVASVIKQKTDITQEKENVEKLVKKLDTLRRDIEKAKEEKEEKSEIPFAENIDPVKLQKLTEGLTQSVSTENAALSPAEKRSFLQGIREAVIKIVTYLKPYDKNPEVKKTLKIAKNLEKQTNVNSNQSFGQQSGQRR